MLEKSTTATNDAKVEPKLDKDVCSEKRPHVWAKLLLTSGLLNWKTSQCRTNTVLLPGGSRWPWDG